MNVQPTIVVGATDRAKLLQCIASAAGGRSGDAVDALEAELARARVVPDAELPGTVVTMGATVVYEDTTSQKRREITLVYPEDADAAQGRISVFAPIGAALIGLSVGQAIDWSVPAGPTRLRVVDVKALAKAA